MPSLGFPFTVAAPTVLKTSRRYVFIKQKSADNWTFTPWLEPSQCREASAPDISSADFVYRFGAIAREHVSALSNYLPVTLRDYYVQIRIQQYGHPLQILWTGVIVSEEWSPKAASAASGDQRVKALGLDAILDRRDIYGAVAQDPARESDLQYIDHSPAFNLRHDRNYSLVGNRSGGFIELDGEEEPNLYVFSTDKGTWTNRNIAEYVLRFFGPTTPRFYLMGELEALDGIEEVHNLYGMSVRESLNKLIDRRKGLAWTIRFIRGNVIVWVYSVADRAYSFGTKELPANSEPVYMDIPTIYPYTHLINTIDIRATSLNQYDTIQVQGQRVKLTGTWGFGYINLEIGWKVSLETSYKDGWIGNDGEDGRFNDLERADDKYDTVYTKYRVPKDWDWKIVVDNLAITPLEDGTFDFDKKAPVFMRNTFNRNTVFETGKDYSAFPLVNNNPTNSDPDFRPMFAVFEDVNGESDDTVWEHDPDGKYHWLHKPNPDDGLLAITVRPLEHEFGFQIAGNPNHYLARNNWDGAKPTEYIGEIDYKHIYITATFDGDMRQKIVVRNQAGTPHESERRLVITVPRAEYWYVSDFTLVGIHSNGNQDYYDAGPVLRDDREMLLTIAGFASAWYGVNRQAVTIPMSEIGWFVGVGSMLTEIRSVWAREPIRTVITARTTNFSDAAQDSTVIETGFGRLDSEPPSAFFATE